MTVEIRDILLKAAEDVQSGMWCKGNYFADEEELHDGHLFDTTKTFDQDITLGAALASRRCAEGSLMVATRLLSGTLEDWRAASWMVNNRLLMSDQIEGLVHFNDETLPDDPFEAGQQLAELFRTTAESL